MVLAATIKGWPVEQVAVGAAMGWAITPDEDIDHATVEELWWDKIPLVGRVIGTIFQMAWLPYARAIPHRDPLSHWPILGTAGRAAYIAAWLFAFELIAGACGGSTQVNWSGIWAYLWPWCFAAWAVQDGLHWTMDYTPILRRM
jgi:hypothetical protein